MSEIRVNLMFLTLVGEERLKRHRCEIELVTLQEANPQLRWFAGETLIWITFPPGTVREKVGQQVDENRHPSIEHAERYRLILPDGIVFDELFHLYFNQSIISLPLVRHTSNNESSRRG